MSIKYNCYISKSCPDSITVYRHRLAKTESSQPNSNVWVECRWLSLFNSEAFFGRRSWDDAGFAVITISLYELCVSWAARSTNTHVLDESSMNYTLNGTRFLPSALLTRSPLIYDDTTKN